MNRFHTNDKINNKVTVLTNIDSALQTAKHPPNQNSRNRPTCLVEWFNKDKV